MARKTHDITVPLERGFSGEILTYVGTHLSNVGYTVKVQDRDGNYLFHGRTDGTGVTLRNPQPHTGQLVFTVSYMPPNADHAEVTRHLAQLPEFIEEALKVKLARKNKRGRR